MQRQANRGTRKTAKIVLACICIAALMWSLCACGETTEDRSRVARGRISPSQTLYDELDRVNAGGASAEAQPESPTIHIILDSNLGDYNGGEGYDAQGFLSKRCVTFQSVMTACSEITSGQDYYGYISCLEGDSGTALEGKWAGAAAGTYFQPLADFYASAVKTSAYAQHNSDLVGLVSDVASCAGESANKGDVFILISDLAMRDVGESNEIADALAKDVLDSESLSMGIVGIQADYAGTIRNVPSSSVGIEPRRVFGTAGNTSQVYQRPLYLLFIGDKTNVLSVMDQFLQVCSEDDYLSGQGQTNSMYYYKLCCRPAGGSGETALQVSAGTASDGVEVAFAGNISEYGQDGYDPAYVFDLTGGGGELDEYRDAIGGIEIAKMYTGQMGESDGNLAVTYRFPYEIVTSPSLEDGAIQALCTETVFDFAENNPDVEVTVKQLKYNTSEIDSTYPSQIVGWEAPAQNLFMLAQDPQFDGARQTAEILCTIDVSQLQQDEPAIFSLTFRSEYMPDRDAIRAVYDTDWMKEWTMDMGVYQTQWAERAYLFTEATKTAYFADTFVSNLLDRQIDLNIESVGEQLTSYDQTVLCGVVLREQAAYYVRNENIKSDEDLEWAFSQDEVVKLLCGN